MAGLVTLLTDFGSRDGYVAAVKGALLARAPDLRIVDVTHEIAPGDIQAAAFVLSQAAPGFPHDTVHLVVVDPGVGSARLALAGCIGAQLYVAPDNGVLGFVLAADEPGPFHAIESAAFASADASPVFHGRDVFAPAAAFLAQGGHPGELGRALRVPDLVRLPGPGPRVDGGETRGSIIHVDRFGNLISDVPLAAAPPAGAVVELAGREIALARSYSDVEHGVLVALRGSSGLLEIAVNAGSAAADLGARRGDVVILRVPRRS